MASEPPKVFISHNRTDRDWAEWIAGTIERAGYEPILQAWHFRSGENFVQRMQEAVAQTDFIIPVFSENYLKSEYTQAEWVAAFAQDPTGKKRRLIPVRVGEGAPTASLAGIKYINLVGLDERKAERALLDGLRTLGKPAQAPTSLERPRIRYPTTSSHMNVRRILESAFYSEWSILRERIDPSRARLDFSRLEDAWDEVFDFNSVERVVEQDLSKRVGRERRIYEQFHRYNLRFLSRLYAQNLFRVSDSARNLNENSIREALNLLKMAWACPYYPCMRQ